MSEIADKVVDLAADAAGEVTEGAEVAEEAIRSLKGVKFSYALLGVAIGGTAGALIGFKVATKKADEKWADILDERVEEEVSEIRETYRSKMVAMENQVAKPQLEDLVREKGYTSTDTTKPPLAVSPPSAVVEAAEEANREHEPPSLSEEVEEEEPETRNIFDNGQPESKWDYERELRGRSPITPYIIHVDETQEMDYETVELVYYEGDDVLCRPGNNNEVVSEEERERLVGERNMTRFGHGSQDRNTVYVRNDELELQFEIIRSQGTYAEEVHGLRHSADGPRRRERHAFDDE